MPLYIIGLSCGLKRIACWDLQSARVFHHESKRWIGEGDFFGQDVWGNSDFVVCKIVIL